MFRTMLKSKIHRATVTQADLHYVGSVTIDADLLDEADLLVGEQVTIVDIDNGARLETYTIAGPRGSGVIGINGAAARLVHPGDLVIIIAYGVMTDAEARTHRPRVLFVDATNTIIARGGDPAAAIPGDPSSLRGDILTRRADPAAAIPGNPASPRGDRPSLRGDIARPHGDPASVRGDIARPHGDPASVRGDVVTRSASMATATRIGSH